MVTAFTLAFANQATLMIVIAHNIPNSCEKGETHINCPNCLCPTRYYSDKYAHIEQQSQVLLSHAVYLTLN